MELPPHDGAPLTDTETRLLAILRGEPGRIFSRGELVARVMPDAIVSERTIDVHVHALRRKLGAEGARVHTVRGQGYTYATP
jgi:DNA-binding response OmpR family regulator